MLPLSYDLLFISQGMQFVFCPHYLAEVVRRSTAIFWLSHICGPMSDNSLRIPFFPLNINLPLANLLSISSLHSRTMFLKLFLSVQITSKPYLLQTIMNMNNLAMSVGQEFENSLAGWFWLRISPEFTVKLCRAGVTCWLYWGWKIQFQDGSSTFLTSWWWLGVRASVPLFMGFSKWLLECLDAAGLPEGKWFKRMMSFISSRPFCISLCMSLYLIVCSWPQTINSSKNQIILIWNKGKIPMQYLLALSITKVKTPCVLWNFHNLLLVK